ncbi:hypothetical protein BBROOKSOX_546 [Bathymodiolus brooksi thiotrophic gill symbiont]|nr:hypothetical protein BBROOKSOX_546 [Bathymodiolus brooksi thiotrophic gill symbiont]
MPGTGIGIGAGVGAGPARGSSDDVSFGGRGVLPGIESMEVVGS